MPDFTGRFLSARAAGTLGTLLLLLLIVSLVPACSGPGYYYQAAAGQMALMRSRQNVDDYLARAADNDELAHRLETARQILAWAGDQLHLPAQDSFQTFAAIDREAVTWNVIATPEFSLQPKTWCFLVAGCVPYRGYFKQEKAQASARKLEKKGLDVSTSRAAAYSTLGWFDDPILDTTLFQSDAGLAGTLIHELAHESVYIKDDTRFNESYASFVESRGVQLWLQDFGTGQQTESWHRNEEASQAFIQLLRQTRDELQEIYTKGGDEPAMRQEKTNAFNELRSNYLELVNGPWQGQDLYGGWFETAPNNADLALVEAYSSGQCAFDRLLTESSHQFNEFHTSVLAMAQLSREERDEWLDQDC